ncbi:uncharacterized protein LOC6051264 [Culex quinquefasciatus]|uniref:uncharacterized protein LOC6051264 n=1 Tax=Culex quinquefasciatus TaxID=7176 RepID=UPI0018E2C58A|nr:uncharacterized protein LOC6051264 [Culex quinquefasciatus]
MMALNIAVPLTTVADLMDGFGLLSPISPLSVDCRGVMAAAAAAAGTHNKSKQQLVSPVGSESSGVSSLDSDEMKKSTSPPTTPTEEVECPAASSPLPSEATIVQDSSRSSSESSARSSLSSTSESESSSGASSEQESSEEVVEVDEPELPEPPKECKLVLGGRDVLNLMDNLTAPNHFRLQFAQLPENDNIHFFLDNRSQYHRLGANGHIQEYTMVGCKRCDFRYPVNGTSLTSSGPTATMGQGSLAAAFPQQQPQPQQPQQQLQWNNLNSIANSRDKMNAAAANAFNSKTFGAAGNQYFRNGGGNNATAPLFGRDSNRGGANFLGSSSTGTYNNHKTYQQQQQLQNNFSGGKFNNYQQQQQQFFSKNHQSQLRYGQSSGGFNAMAAALAANQSLANFSGKGSANNSNMFAYYKTMM